MDTLLWSKLNGDIRVQDTKKKFFNQYLYKLIVKVPACRLILNSKASEIRQNLQKRRDDMEEFFGTMPAYSRGYMVKNWGKNIDGAMHTQLEYYSVIKDKYPELKLRIEEPNLTIYSNSEQLLYDIAAGDMVGNLLEIHKPYNDAAAEALERGEVMVGDSIPYEYKIVFKEGKAPGEERGEQIYERLTELGDAVKLTPSCKRVFTSKRYWTPSTYMYVKDEMTASFIKLILPSEMIAGIFKLTKVSHK